MRLLISLVFVWLALPTYAQVYGSQSAHASKLGKATQNFCLAVANNNLQMMGLFLQQGAEIDDVNCLPASLLRETPLMVSIGGDQYISRPDAVGFLLDHGANPNHSAKVEGKATYVYAGSQRVVMTGETPLMLLASANGSNEAMFMSLFDKMFNHGAQVNLQDIGGNTALDYAVAHGYDGGAEMLVTLKIIRYLVKERGADIDHRNRIGLTPLMIAVQGCGVAEVELLLSLGAKPALSNQKGETAATLATDTAVKSNNPSCNATVQVLQNPQGIGDPTDALSQPGATFGFQNVSAAPVSIAWGSPPAHTIRPW